MPEPSPVIAADPYSNGVLIRRLFGLAWRYRSQCLRVLGLQLVLLTLGLSGLSLTGLGIDYIRYVVAHQAAPGTMALPVFPRANLGLRLPETWEPLGVIL